MKKMVLLSLSMMLFSGLMWYNVKRATLQADTVESGISLIQIGQVVAMANIEEDPCVYWEGGEIVVECGMFSGCCHICMWNPYGNNYCYWTGNPNQKCEVDLLGAC